MFLLHTHLRVRAISEHSRDWVDGCLHVARANVNNQSPWEGDRLPEMVVRVLAG